MTNEKKTKILFIAGAGRSGSTVLDRILGQIPGFFSLGEFHSIWPNIERQEWLCGCGKIFKQCDFWNGVLRDAFESAAEISGQVQIYKNPGGDRIRYAPLLMVPGTLWLLTRRLRRNLDGLVKIYRAIQKRSDSRVIVDSSKLPTYGFAISQAAALDVYVVHLIRDQRGVAYSWLRRKARSDTSEGGKPAEYMNNWGTAASSLIWDSVNIACEKIWKRTPERYLRLRYEDFIAEPAAQVRRICAMLGEDAGVLSFVKGNQVTFRTDHTVAGNPSRMAEILTLKPDDEWRTKLSRADLLKVNLLTWPLLKRYGYVANRSENGLASLSAGSKSSSMLPHVGTDKAANDDQ